MHDYCKTAHVLRIVTCTSYYLGVSLLPKRNAMEIEVGLRVARGPDWQWGDQDGGEGCLGTITGMGGQGNAEATLPQVLWDYGYRSNNYRCGKEGKHDLVVYDSAPTGKPGLY